MKIWGRANSINVMKVLWAADECGIAYERTDVGGAFGGNDQKWYLDMNPNGVVPTIDDGGRVIWESNSAVRYLSAKYAAGTLWPNDPGQRSDADRWMDWQIGTISEPMRICFWGLIRTPPEKRDMAAIKKAAADAGKLWGRLDQKLGLFCSLIGNVLVGFVHVARRTSRCAPAHYAVWLAVPSRGGVDLTPMPASRASASATIPPVTRPPTFANGRSTNPPEIPTNIQTSAASPPASAASRPVPASHGGRTRAARNARPRRTLAGAAASM